MQWLLESRCQKIVLSTIEPCDPMMIDEDPLIAVGSQAEIICRTRVRYLDSSSTRTEVGQG